MGSGFWWSHKKTLGCEIWVEQAARFLCSNDVFIKVPYVIVEKIGKCRDVCRKKLKLCLSPPFKEIVTINIL